MRTGLLAILLTWTACFPSAGLAQWYASADFMPLRRCDSSNEVYQRSETLPVSTTTSGVTTTTPSVVGSNVLLGCRDVQMDFVAGGRVTVGNRFAAEAFGLEGSYLLMGDGKVAASAQGGIAPAPSSNGLMASPFSPVGFPPNLLLDNNLSVTLDYRSQLQSIELHVTQMMYEEENGDAMLLVGIRAMSIDESFEYVSNNGTYQNDFRTKTDNRLIGPQVGMLARTPVPGGFLSAKLRGALLWNAISEDVVVNGVPGHVDDDKGSLVGEIAFDYWYFPTPRLALRMGYQVLGMNEIGLASENLVSSPIVTSVNTGGMIYHGPCLGVVLNY